MRMERIEELMARSSLGCPNRPRCEHLIGDHKFKDADSRGNPIGATCTRCDCGKKKKAK